MLRPAQPTLGCCILAAKSDALSFGALEGAAHAELSHITAQTEAMLKAVTDYTKINYLMLMMADPHVHFHVIPRYEGVRTWGGMEFTDAGWPKTPELGSAIALDEAQITALVSKFLEQI